MENGKTHLWHSSFLYTLFSFSFWKQLPRWRCIKFGNNQYYSRSRCFKYITKWNFPSVYFMKTKFLYQIHCDILYSIKIAFHLLNTEFLDRTTEIIYKIYSVYQYIVYGIQIQCNANKIHWLLRSFFFGGLTFTSESMVKGAYQSILIQTKLKYCSVCLHQSIRKYMFFSHMLWKRLSKQKK